MLYVVCASLPSWGAEVEKPQSLTMTDMRESSRYAVAFDENQNEVSVALPDKTFKPIRAELARVFYKGTLITQSSWGPLSSVGYSNCFELSSKDKKVPCKWSFWTGLIPGHFKTFTDVDKRTYLTWVDSYTVCFADVSTPMDEPTKQKRLSVYLNKDKLADIQHFDVEKLIGREPFTDDNTTKANYAAIYLMSLNKEPKGGFRITLHGIDPAEVHTVVTDKESDLGWRLDD